MKPQTLLSSCLLVFALASPMLAIADTEPGTGVMPIVKDSDAQSLTADMGAQNLTMVDGIDRFKRNYFLKKAYIELVSWIDDRRILVRAFDNPANRAHPGLEPRAYAVIDTETGAIERMPWKANTYVVCFNNGRIALWEPPSSDTGNLAVWYVGNFGGGMAMSAYWVKDTYGNRADPKEWKEQGLGLDTANCRLSKSFWVHPAAREFIETRTTRSASAKALDMGQGWLIETHLWRADTPEQRMSTYLLIKGDGSRVLIPTTAGERGFTGSSYLPFADAYFTYPELHFGNPQHVWSPHFARMIHPDGRVERFPVPGPLMDQIINHQESVRAQYTRGGPLWNLSVNFMNRDSDRLGGGYLVMGQELVRVAQRVFYNTSPSGCKLAGESEQTWQQLNDLRRISDLRDYFVINLCKE